MSIKSKRMKDAFTKFDKETRYSIEDAVKLLRDTTTVKFDPSVEMHFNLGIDPRKSDQLVRGNVVLPHGTGKKVSIVVFADGELAQEATKAGADIVGADELIAEIKKTGNAPYDAAIASPDMMKKLGPIARTLGVKGIMPNPKKETVTTNITKAIEDIRKGKIDFRNDDTSNIHQVIGKLSFDDKKLIENIQTFIDTIKKVKPSGSKGIYIKNMVVTSSMGPSIKLIIA